MRSILFLLLVSLGLLACKNEGQKVSDTPEATFYLIRHAEKDRSDPEHPNPPLTDAGSKRARVWARYFDSIPLKRIYSTNYTRTKMTVAPLSIRQDLPVIHYQPAELYHLKMIEENLGSNILIVGHSNTIPELANKLLGEDRFAQMDDSDNSTLYVVRANEAGRRVEVRKVMSN